eukprot:11517222-Heterocapsa_arctica.AAC.1
MSVERCEMKNVVKRRRLVTTAAMFVDRAMDPGGVCRRRCPAGWRRRRANFGAAACARAR